MDQSDMKGTPRQTSLKANNPIKEESDHSALQSLPGGEGMQFVL